jgi:hypothetical protein
MQQIKSDAHASIASKLERIPLVELAFNPRKSLLSVGVTNLVEQLRWEAVLATCIDRWSCEPVQPNAATCKTQSGSLKPPVHFYEPLKPNEIVPKSCSAGERSSGQDNWQPEIPDRQVVRTTCLSTSALLDSDLLQCMELLFARM